MTVRGIGTVTGTDKGIFRHLNGRFDLEQDGTVFFHSFRSYIFQGGIKRTAIQSTDCQFDRHAFMDTSYFCFIHFSPEDHIVHIGYGSNCRTVIECILTVPESCVEFSGDSTFVQIVKQEKPEQLFEKRAVTVGLSDGIKIEVKEGLSEGDKIRGGIVAANK